MSAVVEEFSEKLYGVWPALPVPWSNGGRIDTGLVTELVNRYKAAGVDGAYTTGTDGEMHVLEREELASLVNAFAPAAAAAELPVQVGCTVSYTEGVIDRARLAQAQGVQCIQIALPSWVPLSDGEVLSFFGSIQEALPDLGVVHYNIARSGRFLTGKDYAAIRAVAPNLIGTKHTGGDVASLIEIVQTTPEMHHFVVDSQIVPGGLFGAWGFYSFLANLNPRYAVALWRDCAQGDWTEAARKRTVIDGFFRDWRQTFDGVTASPALAKIATRAGILPEMPLAVRAPYRAGTEDHVQALRTLLESKYPELVYVP
jgi:dihydrodipicolinate synthase/N-acetylneuraminate lyase